MTNTIEKKLGSIGNSVGRIDASKNSKEPIVSGSFCSIGAILRAKELRDSQLSSMRQGVALELKRKNKAAEYSKMFQDSFRRIT